MSASAKRIQERGKTIAIHVYHGDMLVKTLPGDADWQAIQLIQKLNKEN